MDLATPVEETQKLIKGFEQGCDVAIGSRANRREGAPLIRKIQSNGFMIIRNVLMGTWGIRDTQCGCKGFSRTAALSIIEKMRVFTDRREASGPSVSAAFDLEFIFLAQKLGLKILEVPVVWRHAETKRVAFWKDSIETLKDLATMRWYALTGKYTF
ncbi:MAG: hypothetical protein UZ21_OP11001000178 [Microgenomates bacterium OLB22]|nr:MAG: hypothetical protein UZ21_OP11001000178 [Microgenomates bacterium OLB22]